MKSPKRFAVGTSVRVRNPGIDGVVLQLDDERSVLSEYWHTIETKLGERREPGCNLELIELPIGHPSRSVRKIAETIHFHGPNSRITVNGDDNSTNTISMAPDELFGKLREKAAQINIDDDRSAILARIDELENAHSSSSFLDAYKSFMASLADHIAIFGPLLPALAKLLGMN